MRARRLGLALLVLAVAPAPAQAAFDPGAEVDRGEQTGKVTYVASSPGHTLGRPSSVSAAAPATDAAVEFLDNNAGAFGLGDGASLDAETVPGDGIRGITTVHLRQRIDGIEVMGGEFRVHLDRSNHVLSAIGEAEPAAHVATPATTGAAAEQAAIAAVVKSEDVSAVTLDAGDTQLAVFDPRIMGGPGLPGARPVWTTEVANADRSVRKLVVVDARLGNVVTTIELVEAAKARSVCDAARGPAQIPCTAPVLTEGGTYSGPGAADVQAAYDYAGATYDFYLSHFGRDSLDGAGLPLKSTVRYCVSVSTCPYANAFWNGSQMVYGQGYPRSDDTVGHELTHGFTAFTSHLFYYAQSGALNESMSDVFGELVDLETPSPDDAPADRWKIGESLPFAELRDMKDPTVLGQPDRIGSPLWALDPGEADSLGVHTNSGVGNKAAYLITDGDTFGGQAVTGIGAVKAARLYYTVETSFLNSASDYVDLGNALNGACTALATAGTDGFTAADCTEVAKVPVATRMAEADTIRSPVPPTCETGTPSDVFFDDMENPASGNWAHSAATGADAWFYPQNPNTAGFDATYAASGVTNLWGYDQPSVADDQMAMTNSVLVPAGALLYFKHAYAFDDSTNGATAYDGGVVEYSTDGGGTWTTLPITAATAAGAVYDKTVNAGSGNPLAATQAFTNDSYGYVATRVPLTALSGQSVRFRFRLGTDNFGDDYGWFIDDVRIYTCGAGADAQPPDTTITSGLADGGGTTSTASQAFDATASEAGSTFECSLDGAAFASCAMPYATGALTVGEHTVAIRAVDAAGNRDPSPATRSFVVDQTAPDTTLTAPADGSLQPRAALVRFTSSEPGSTFACNLVSGSVPSATFSACASPTRTSLATGTYTLSVRATDRAGNVDPTPAKVTFAVDATAPDTSITGGPAAATTIDTRTATFELAATEAGSTFECRVDASAFEACTTPYTTPTLADGSHTVRFRATDALGNTDPAPAVRTFAVDAPPDTTITGGPAEGSLINVSTPSFAFTSDESGTTFECSVDGGTFAACTSAASLPALDEGPHTFAVRAVNTATDPTPATRTFTVDTVAPETSLTAGPADGALINVGTPSFEFTSPDPFATFKCAVDGGPFATCTPPFTVPPLADGAHTVSVAAVDAAGNVDASPATRSWTLDTAAPDTSLSSGPADGATIATPTATFGLSSTEAGSTFECAVDAGAFAACTSPFTTPVLADGLHAVEVRATDAAGNVDATPVSRAFTVASPATPSVTATATATASVTATATATPSASPTAIPSVTPTPAAMLAITKVKVTRKRIAVTLLGSPPGTLELAGKAAKRLRVRFRPVSLGLTPATVKAGLSKRLRATRRRRTLELRLSAALVGPTGTVLATAARKVKLKKG